MKFVLVVDELFQNYIFKGLVSTRLTVNILLTFFPEIISLRTTDLWYFVHLVILREHVGENNPSNVAHGWKLVTITTFSLDFIVTIYILCILGNIESKTRMCVQWVKLLTFSKNIYGNYFIGRLRCLMLFTWYLPYTWHIYRWFKT